MLELLLYVTLTAGMGLGLLQLFGPWICASAR